MSTSDLSHLAVAATLMTSLSPACAARLPATPASASPRASASELGTERERVSFDAEWRFALGHASEPQRDFGFGTRYFSYLAKTGYGDGPASPAFDDRGWRVISVPHDWAVEVPFDANASPSHGYRAVGRGFPQNSVGWYRKTFALPVSDLGRRIRVTFDGAYRAAKVFINGFYVGEEPSGTLPATYDLSDYLHYGGDNVLAVRVDASLEEGWYYEGAGIYRHVWLTKSAPTHLVDDGTWVHCELDDDGASVLAESEVVNHASVPMIARVLDPDGNEQRLGFTPCASSASWPPPRSGGPWWCPRQGRAKRLRTRQHLTRLRRAALRLPALAARATAPGRSCSTGPLRSTSRPVPAAAGACA